MIDDNNNNNKNVRGNTYNGSTVRSYNNELPSMTSLVSSPVVYSPSRRASIRSGCFASPTTGYSAFQQHSSMSALMSNTNGSTSVPVTIKLHPQLPCFRYTPAFDSQTRVYDFIGPKMYNAAMSGFNTCLFAYGQTGSGKTYSMIGPPEKLLPLSNRAHNTSSRYKGLQEGSAFTAFL
uniref:Kinesin-like protein KIF1B n=1 Tax=Lygus hesperus TaxID=30085 RepID=A0A0A9YIL5_LYGHE